MNKGLITEIHHQIPDIVT